MIVLREEVIMERGDVISLEDLGQEGGRVDG